MHPKDHPAALQEPAPGGTTSRAARHPELETSVSDQVLICMRRIIQSIDRHSHRLVKRVGLTGPQLVILQEVSRCGEVSMGEVAKAISLGQATMTGIIERLEKRGLIARRRSESDRRRVLIRLTESGHKLLDGAPSLLQESFVEQFNCLQDWEQAMILSSLQRLVMMMDARRLKAAAILTTGPILTGGEKGETRGGGASR